MTLAEADDFVSTRVVVARRVEEQCYAYVCQVEKKTHEFHTIMKRNK